MTAPTRPRRPPATAAVAAAGRRRPRDRDARRRRLHRVAVVLAVLLPLSALAWLVLLSPVLGVADVDVLGTSRVSVEQVRAAAAVPPGTPLARLRVGAVAGRVEAALPAVADVRVRRVWPRTLRLQVTERVAVAGVQRPDGVLLLSADGVAFATEPTRPAGLADLAVPTPGRDDPATRAALDVLAALPAGLRGQVASVSATTGQDVHLALTDKRTVVWGGAGDAATKAAELTALLKLPGTAFDVSAPGIVVRR